MIRLAFTKCHGSGNDFALIDARTLTLADAEWAMVARTLTDRSGPVGGDGLLLLTEGRDDCAFGMRIINADGSEPETCLNGLRCVARAGFEALGIAAARVRLKTSIAEVSAAEPLALGVTTVRTRVGPVSTDPGDVGLNVTASVVDAVVPGLPSARAFTALAMPNPHLVSFVETIDEGELAALGDWCEARPPLLVDRANVSFVEMRGGETMFVRTYERGVGPTAACGSAMAAAVFAAGLSGRVAFGIELLVLNPGGGVRACAEAPATGGMATVAGNATFEWRAEIAVDLATGETAELIVTDHHDNEVAAWARVVANLR